MSGRASKTAWLSSKLKQFALDEDVYLNYIESVLDGEEDRCEKIGALEAILGDVLSENEVRTQCAEIMDVYDAQNGDDETTEPAARGTEEETLVRMLENNIRTVVSSKADKRDSTEEDLDLVQIRKNILSQYAQAYIFGNNSSICKKPCRAYDKSAIYHDRNLRKAAYKLIVDKLKESEPKANKDAVKEANSEDEECCSLDIEDNTNVSSVQALKKEQRERAKQLSLQKKEKDKEDREKQKQLAQEKKDIKKKKAQKVERKR